MPSPDQHPRSALPALSDLAARARAGYHLAPPVTGTLDRGWWNRAARATRILASLLGVDPLHVVASPDPERVYGLLGTPEVLLTVSSTSRRFLFVPEHGRPTDTFVWLSPCPGCERRVAAYRVACLVDLGRHLARPGAPDADRFGSDPAHAPSCPHRQDGLRFGSLHRPAAPAPAPHPSMSPPPLAARARRPAPCPCDCNSGRFCGGCGHAGCGGR